VKGGAIGGAIGLAAGTGAVLYAQRRFPAFQSLTLPFRVFIGVSSGTLSAIIAADRASQRFETFRNKDRLQYAMHKSDYERFEESKPLWQRSKDWAAENRYSIVFASWVASMGIAFQIVRRDKYLTGAQKLVQARVYAQGLTIAVLLASFALEAKDATQKQGRWETIKVLDPSDPLHKRLIEKKIHHERYEGEDQWLGKFSRALCALPPIANLYSQMSLLARKNDPKRSTRDTERRGKRCAKLSNEPMKRQTKQRLSPRAKPERAIRNDHGTGSSLHKP
jgi:hypothetical protein